MDPSGKKAAVPFLGTPRAEGAPPYDEFQWSRRLYEMVRAEMATGLRPDQAAERIASTFEREFAQSHPDEEIPWQVGGIASDHTRTLPGGSPTEDGRHWIQATRIERDRTDFPPEARINRKWLEQMVISYHPDFRMAQLSESDGIKPAHWSLGRSVGDIEGIASDGAHLWVLARSRGDRLEESILEGGNLQTSIAFAKDNAAEPPGLYLRHVALLGGTEVPGVPALVRLDQQVFGGTEEQRSSGGKTWIYKQTIGPQLKGVEEMKKPPQDLDDTAEVKKDDDVEEARTLFRRMMDYFRTEVEEAAQGDPASDTATEEEIDAPEGDADLDDLCVLEEESEGDEKSLKRRQAALRLVRRGLSEQERQKGELAALKAALKETTAALTRMTEEQKLERSEATIATLRAEVEQLVRQGRVAPGSRDHEVTVLSELSEETRKTYLEQLKVRRRVSPSISAIEDDPAKNVDTSRISPALRLAANSGDPEAVAVAALRAHHDLTTAEGRQSYITALRTMGAQRQGVA